MGFGVKFRVEGFKEGSFSSRGSFTGSYKGSYTDAVKAKGCWNDSFKAFDEGFYDGSFQVCCFFMRCPTRVESEHWPG